MTANIWTKSHGNRTKSRLIINTPTGLWRDSLLQIFRPGADWDVIQESPACLSSPPLWQLLVTIGRRSSTPAHHTSVKPGTSPHLCIISLYSNTYICCTVIDFYYHPYDNIIQSVLNRQWMCGVSLTVFYKLEVCDVSGFVWLYGHLHLIGHVTHQKKSRHHFRGSHSPAKLKTTNKQITKPKL